MPRSNTVEAKKKRKSDFLKRKAKKKDLDFFNKFVSAFWAGDLDLTATFWNADFLSAGRAAQVAVGAQILQTGNFRGDRADDGIGQLHEFLVFRITPADVARKNPPDANSSQHKGKDVKHIPTGKGKNNIEQKARQSA